MGKRLLFGVAAAVVVVAAGTAIVAVTGSGHTPKRAIREHPTPIPAAMRTVALSKTMPMPSASPRRLSAMLEQGEMPGPTTAKVLTDTDCAPDADGISHCRNELRLPGGKTIVVRHPHDMSRVPCLAPGEQVRLIPG